MSTINVNVLNPLEVLKLPRLTLAERNALTPEQGFVIFNITDFEVQLYNGTEWVNIAKSPFEAEGGTVVDSGGYRIHTFTGDGFFNVTSGPGEVEYLVVAGGGGGGGWGGGGGAGGYRSSVTGEFSGENSPAESKLTLDVGSYSISVGGGGPRGGTGYTGGSNGSDSRIVGSGGIDVTSIGGGGGGYWQGNAAKVGGSGGGGSGTGTGANGTTGQGNRGGNGQGSQSTPYLGHGGGGGAGQVGQVGSGVIGGPGGDGLPSAISGQVRYYAGGGGGHSPGQGNASTAPGGQGGGGRSGNYYNPAAAEDGEDGTGGGGGGAYGQVPAYQCGNGGKGIVVIRYPLA